ncbi:MAG: hypothetical protein COZ59_00590, partial [Bacteroidetes bacterium CG_4_8_14_3_um_filter_31_14]
MRKIKHLTLALSLLLSAGIVFGQAEKSASISNQLVLKNQKIISVNDISPSAHKTSTSTNYPKTQWDILYYFNALAGGEQAVETDGNFIYTTNWGGTGTFHKYDMTGTWVSDFTITGVSAIRDLAFDGTYFYGAAANMSLFKIDFIAGTLVSTITATCSGVTGIRHCEYDPTLNSGAG